MAKRFALRPGRVWLVVSLLVVLQTGVLVYQELDLHFLDPRSYVFNDKSNQDFASGRLPRPDSQTETARPMSNTDDDVTGWGVDAPGDKREDGSGGSLTDGRVTSNNVKSAQHSVITLTKKTVSVHKDLSSNISWWNSFEKGKMVENSSRRHEKADSQGDRLARVLNVCREHQAEIPGETERMFVYEKQKVAYCSTHKIASTFWMRIFRWLYNDTGRGQVSSPLMISKLDAHLLPFKILRVRNVTGNPQDSSLVNSSFRFLFTREPFARLWSVYIDKFLLPDNYFWSYFSPRIKASVYGTQRGTAKIKPYQGNFKMVSGFDLLMKKAAGSNQRKAACHQVTFPEFLQYIVNTANQSTGKALDDHFRPVHYGCHPCRFRPHFIGKMESMHGDSEQMLKEMRLQQLLPELHGAPHALQEVDLLVDFNFDLVVNRGHQKHCVSNKDLERRLLRAFIYNGYLSEDSETLLENRLPLGQIGLKQTLKTLFLTSNRTSTDIKAQRIWYQTKAYREVSEHLLRSVQNVFHWDFELFGYQAFPKEIFPNGY